MSSREGGSLPPQGSDRANQGPRPRGDAQKVGGAIRAAAGRLLATSDTARLDAEVLMAHALGLSRSDMLLRALQSPAPAGFEALIERRMAHEPVAYITGTAEFWGLSLAVTPATLIPRADSETLVRAALAAAGPVGRALDLGTGSGALLLALLAERPEWEGVGIDASAPALGMAASNAAALGLAGRSAWHVRDWRRPDWAAGLGGFDCVLANPPYVEAEAELDADVARWEPASALFAGPDGLDDYRVLIPALRAVMNAGAVAILEIGSSQSAAVSTLAEEAGFAWELAHDLAKRPRALILR